MGLRICKASLSGAPWGHRERSFAYPGCYAYVKGVIMTGNDLQCRRRKIGLTQRQLAKELCVSIQSVQFWETGRRNMSRSTEKLFCLLYGFDFNASKGAFDDDRLLIKN